MPKTTNLTFKSYTKLVLLCVIFLTSLLSTNLGLAQSEQQENEANEEEEISHEIKNPTTIGLSILNSAIAIEPFATVNLLSSSRLTYANQLFFEQEIGKGFGLMADVLYFTESFVTRNNASDFVDNFSGFQIEFGVTKNIFRLGKLYGQLEASYFIGPHTYQNTEITDPLMPEQLLTEIEYDITGFKISTHLEYKLNTLFSLFFKSSFNSYNIAFEAREDSFTKFFPIDAFGISRSF